MSEITEGNAEQYGDSRKLAARARLHRAYTIAEIGWFPWVARKLPIRAGDSVLDIGCGPAWFWANVADGLPDRFDLTLADLSAGMVAEAVERCAALRHWTVDGCEADAAGLPFADATFDTVVAMHMMYHVADQAAAIAEMHRVLKPGGRLAVTTNGVGNLQGLYELTTVFGSAPVDPAAVAFGYETAERLMKAQFGNLTMSEHPAHMRITDPEDAFLALTSFPPGDRAAAPRLAALHEAIARAFEEGDSVLDTPGKSALFLSRKDG